MKGGNSRIRKQHGGDLRGGMKSRVKFLSQSSTLRCRRDKNDGGMKNDLWLPKLEQASVALPASLDVIDQVGAQRLDEVNGFRKLFFIIIIGKQWIAISALYHILLANKTKTNLA
ncbi:hypothetical protein ElyMa_005711100 [Elysia marginata]|uniref:Uncharacterized protein n=1 Tax=Elysia marginata TaxID=1093978 RepID=A0AAV4FHT4_9GAST|nr:hypothetical protein ElyMa_005711100 [Elysia marginata]